MLDSSGWFPQNGILYVIFCLIFVCEPRDLAGLGVSVEGICAGLLGSREDAFLQYQIRRFYVSILFHSCLPIFYACYLPEQLAKVYLPYAMTPAILALSVIMLYHYEVLLNPIERQVIRMKMISESFGELVRSINQEVRSPNKFWNENRNVIVTERFIIKIGTYQTFICRQTEAQLKLLKIDNILVPGSQAPDQKLTQDQNVTIEVTAGQTKFTIFVKGSEFEEFNFVLSAPLPDMENFEAKDLWTKFAEESLNVVEMNQKSERREIDDEEDDCFGCTVQKCEVRLTTCQCRAMWCFSCLMRCFAAHQHHQGLKTTQWMSGKCLCPNCRTEFNILDISFLDDLDHVASSQ